MRVVTQDVRSARAASLFRAGGRSENLELGGAGGAGEAVIQILLMEQVFLLIRPKYGKGALAPSAPIPTALLLPMKIS